MATENDINTLIQQLDISEELLRFNSVIENNITINKGKVVYSFNNMIIASEISEEYYSELSKNPLIESIYVVPLKRYGDVDTKLIGQLDITKLKIEVFGTSGTDGTVDLTGTSGSSGSSGTDGTSGTSGNQSGSNTIPPVVGIKPSITSSLIVGAFINTQFTYKIVASGTTPIIYNITPNVIGTVSLEGDTIKGTISNYGKFNIEIKAINLYGMDTKTLVVSVPNPPKIISSLTGITGTIGSPFSYTILSNQTGVTYNVYGISSISGLTWAGSSSPLITGTPAQAGVYNVTLYVGNSNGSDYKNLPITISGVTPVITSSSLAEGRENVEFIYNITGTGIPTPTYTITGSLPNGLSLKTNYIDGIPTEACIRNVIINASNSAGTTSKNLQIIIRVLKP